jgi:hypothetical protein
MIDTDAFEMDKRREPRPTGRRLPHSPTEASVVSLPTVKTHAGRILTKLELRDRVQAVVLAYESGLIEPGARD